MSSTSTAADELRQILTEYCNRYMNISDSVENLLSQVSEDLRYELLSSITYSNGNTVLEQAAGRGHTELCVTLLLSLPPADRLRLIIVDVDTLTALHRAAYWGHTETVSGILSCLNADQQLHLLFTQDSFGNTALHYAARKRLTETAKTLLDIMTPEQQLKHLSVKDKEGNTASQEAVGYDGNSYTMRTLEHYQKEAHYGVNFRKYAKFS